MQSIAATLICFHRYLARRKYARLYGNQRKKPGPKGPSQLLIRYVLECKKLNPHYGCERIALHASRDFAERVTHQTVRRILRKYLHYFPHQPNGPSWWTFFAHTKDSLWALDLFRVESISLQTYWVMIVMDIWSRKIIGFGAHKESPCGEDICYLFNKISAGKVKPKFLSTDNDPLFRFDQWKANLRVIEITEKKSLPHVPLSHPFIERAIGTTRREFLDQTLIWNQKDLERKLEQFKEYYNLHRVHSPLGAQSPSQKRKEGKKRKKLTKNFSWAPVCGGLFHTPTQVNGKSQL